MKTFFLSAFWLKHFPRTAVLTNCSQSFWLSLGFGDLAPRPWHEVRRWPLISFSRITHTPCGLGSSRVEWSGAGLHCFSTGMRMWLVKRACRARVLLCFGLKLVVGFGSHRMGLKLKRAFLMSGSMQNTGVLHVWNRRPSYSSQYWRHAYNTH